MRRHPQGFQGTKERGVNNAIDTKQSSKDLSAQGRKGGSLEYAEGLLLVVVVWEFGLVVDLVDYPLEDFFDVEGRGYGYGGGVAAGSFGPAVFDAGGEAFARVEGAQVGVGGHDCPDCGDVVVEVDCVDCYPSRTRFTRWEGYSFSDTSTSSQSSFRISVQSITHRPTSMTEWLEGSAGVWN